MRLIKFVVGLLLLPLCVAVSRTVGLVILSLQPATASHLPASFWGLVIGFALWIFLWLVLPRPLRTYVLAHELSHGLWAWVMGAEVRKLKVSKRGGSVKVSKSNFLITLAPYFFPFYTVCVIIVHFGISLFFDQSLYTPFWLGCVGLTWAFHLTFTLAMLRPHQPDIKEQGQLFSYTVIYMLNVLGIGLWVVMVASPTLEAFVTQLGADLALTWSFCTDWALRGWSAVRG